MAGCNGNGNSNSNTGSTGGGSPTIASLSPASGAVGTTVTIVGSNFGSAQGSSTVTFNGVSTTAPSAWSAGSITVTVPSGATTGNVVVTVGGTPSNGVAFTVAPGITSLNPTSGAVGATVTITGSNFGSSQGSSTVAFNGVSAGTASAWSASSITVTVPAGATTGNVVVTVSGTASNGVGFTVTPSTPNITSLNPASGSVGSSVTITGTNFGSSQGSSTVTFNGVSAGTATAWSASSITVTVPTGANTGNVVVTVGGHASNGSVFTITSSSANMVTGTAALGSAIANAPVTLVDAYGNISTGTTGADGSLTINTGGMTPPFLVKVVTTSTVGSYPAGTTLYGVSADTGVTTHINIHLLSDLIVRSWYSAQGLNPNSAFTNPVSGNAAPNPAAVQMLAQTVIEAMQLWLSNAGVNATSGAPANGSINLISSAFTANNTGLDAVLHSITSEVVNSGTGAVTQLTASGGTVTQTITPAYKAGSLSLNSTITDTTSGSSTTASASTVLPVGTALQNALNGVTAGIAAFQNVVNTKGSALKGSDLLPFYAADYLKDGTTATQASSSTAASLAGVNLAAVQITGISSFDATNNILDVLIETTLTLGSVTQMGPGEIIFKLENGSWLQYGDQHLGSVSATAQSRTAQGAPSLGVGVSHGVYITAFITAPHGVVTGATVSGGGSIWNGQTSGTLTEGATIQQSGATLDNFLLLSQNLGTNVSQLPAPGTPFTFNLTTASSGSPQYIVPSNGFTTEAISFSGISSTAGSGPLSSVVGKTLTYNWALPTTFAIGQVSLFAYLYDGPATSSTSHSCSINATTVAQANTSGTITIPANMSACGLTGAIQQVNVFLEIGGINGEDSLDALVYPY